MKKYFLHRESSSLKLDYQKELNPEQYAVAMHQSGPMLVLAGAGTGKTRTVTYRVARLIETGIGPENLLLLTFTNKAAREMMRRVEGLIGRNIHGLWGGTFHHIGNIVLRRHCQRIGYKEGFSILDREDAKDLFDICLAEIKNKEAIVPKGSVLCDIYSLTKNRGAGIHELIPLRFPHFSHVMDEIEHVITLYDAKKQNLNLMDFDDLLTNWKKLLLLHENIREYYTSKFMHVLVDEYQDTNRLQAEIVDLLSSAHRNLMVVGDDAQSIYSFRGADFENILKFPERYPDVSMFNLTINYRSTPEILHLANQSIIHNVRQFHKELLSVRQPGDRPSFVPLKDVFQQADFVAQKILDTHADGMTLDGIAILYRSHYQSMELQMELQRRGIPFEIRSGLKFFEQAHIKDILSFLRIVINPYDELSWKRIVKLIPGIGNVTAGKIWDAINQSGNPLDAIGETGRLIPRKALDGFTLFLDLLKILRNEEQGGLPLQPSAAIDQILKHGYEDYLYSHFPNAEDRIQDIEQMMRFALRYTSLETFVSELSLQSASGGGVEEGDAVRECVILSTVHQAKGLEWDTVFMIGLNDGSFPSAKSLKTGDEEEERRLFYVAATRARNDLYLCCPIASGGWQSINFLRPSRFIRELPGDVYEEILIEEDFHDIQ
ncbi:MAG TPA: ATP-dependent helicase [Thermodesulfovibrionales bacterium]|nr:ATP-dependent helicase [Thermodesulfovibrionales bacterium]